MKANYYYLEIQVRKHLLILYEQFQLSFSITLMRSGTQFVTRIKFNLIRQT